MKVNWKKSLVKGVIIWVVAFIVASVLIALGITNSYLSWIIVTIIIAVVAYKFAKQMKIENMPSAISLGIYWVIIVLLLDLIVTSRFTTMAFFNDIKIWVSYAIVLVIPAFAIGGQAKLSNRPDKKVIDVSPEDQQQ